ncbi:MAG: right-handed parallel beta-helix repeat-containing protein, partial [Planctomycetota bacterium]|nr:right-handed parallel beta-helix repeat-containing protein [Planctomycetota bacterium]
LDKDSNGVIHIVGDGIDVEFLDPPLHGAEPGTAPDAFTGIGIRVEGTGVSLHGAIVSGYKVGIFATQADDLTLHHVDVSGNFRQRLGSTPQLEDPEDWLWPHENDESEWIEKYGAGVCIKDSNQVVLHDIKVRDGQNGIILDRVDDSLIYDNDCSFLSGWGLALWRSSGNTITRNAFDFCVRGYSHKIYNRGQDSAGILLFEQCNDNLIALNSATHCGDGLFAFAGREALGESNPKEDESWYKGRGHTGNRIIGNDFSDSVAHGLELTFSFDNVIDSNRFVGNAICGIWGGYSQDLRIAGNVFENNGEMAYGQERGGINIEHGLNNTIFHNTFRNNACGIHLWWDDDKALLASPWAKMNHPDSSDTLIHDNRFEGDAIAVQLRDTKNTKVSNNTFERVGQEYALQRSEIEEVSVAALMHQTPRYEAHGKSNPVGARTHLQGREHVILDEWGPYDWVQPLLHFVKESVSIRGGRRLEYRVLGSDVEPEVRTTSTPALKIRSTTFTNAQTGEIEKVRLSLNDPADSVCLLNVQWRFPDRDWQGEFRTIVNANWKVKQFASPCDPREDVETWREAGEQADSVVNVSTLDFDFAMKGPESMEQVDHFGTIATTTLSFPAGTWRIRTTSDDGLRLWVDESLVIDDWTWHAPKEHVHEFTLDEPRTVEFRVEHFELDGYSILRLKVESIRK